MSLTETTYWVVGASFALYILIAIRSRAGTTQEFYVAGKGIHPVANGMATAADWMSAASFISMAGLIGLSYNGYGGSVFLMGWTGGYVILAMLIAPYLRKYGKFTVPEFIGDRYYSDAARVVAVICLIICSVTYVIGQMKGIGVAFSRFLETDYETGLFSGMFIVFFYAVLGGMKGITYTQIAQFCVLIFAYTVPAIFISLQLTGQPIPQLGLGSTLADGTYLLQKLDQTLLDLGFQEYTTSVRGSTLNMAAFTASLMIGTAGLPHVIIRFFTVPTVRAARASAGWALLFIAVLYTTAPAVAAMARLNIMQTLAPEPGQHLAIEERPAWFKNWEQTGLLGIDDKNGDGLIQYSADPETNELVKLDNDILVLANPEIANLPNWVIALVAAGGLAAALSTAAGLLLAISSAISHDLLKRTLMPDISERQELMASRLAMAVAVLGAGYLGLNPPGFAAGTVALAFGLAAASLFPALLLGIFSKRVTREGAILGMLAGIGVTLAYVFQHKGIMFIPGTGFLGDLPPNWFFGIEPNAFGVVGALVNFTVSLFVSRLTAPPPESVQQLVEDIRIPVSPRSS
ncbi:MAG: cation acetate symporter [Halieaceae bacterium]|jgi:cation/acetate symporter|nr:cation acetate symporter [Halieaceae bacterium]MDG1932279.1 cation acetate symporter [Luminiphilus sp.]MDG2038331.1 cation acetate symporter [Luminiphilus sp.]RZO81640.1 MAG: cation acetate symporter [Halieaceae bacterium]|tara:strand:+ start:1512 stop:3236 length:1725 start_codon:yes stop_codon:yes gene_type:complete